MHGFRKYSGDCISFVAYVRRCNNWQALKELQAYCGLADSREQDRQETRRRILLQQEQERKKEERKKQFRQALYGCISSLKKWAYIYGTALEKCLYGAFSGMWCYCMDELEKINYWLDILCATGFKAYGCMKYHGRYNTWLSDTLGVLESMGMSKATPGELKEIERGGNIGW